MYNNRVNITNKSNSLNIDDIKILGMEEGKFLSVNGSNEAEWVNITPADIEASSAVVGQILTVNGDKEGEWQDNFHVAALKVHKTGTTTLANPNVWTDIEFNLKIADQTTSDFHYYDEGGGSEDASIIVCESAGIFWVGGCLHSYWNNIGGGVKAIASRIIFSNDDGVSWDEARCLQMYDQSSQNASDYMSHPYTGTLYVEAGWWIKLQWQADDVDLELGGNAVFDNPVGATLGIYGVTS